MTKKLELTETHHWRLDVAIDEPGQPKFWRGGGADDSEESVYEPGETLDIAPGFHAPGSRLDIEIPGAWEVVTWEVVSVGKEEDDLAWFNATSGIHLNPCQAMRLSPIFPAGTYVVLSEPDNPKFYDRVYGRLR